MRFDLAATLLTLGCACSTPATSTPTKNPTGTDLPVLHGAAVHGPFPNEAALCQAVYAGQANCLKRTNERVTGPTSVTTNGFGRVDIVEAGFFDDRCALSFQIADRLYIHPAPGLCSSIGHSVYMPKVRDIAFRDLDGVSPRELVIIADIEIVYDELDNAPPRESPSIPAITMAVICGQRGGGTPSCVEVTTNAPEEFVATHEFSF